MTASALPPHVHILPPLQARLRQIYEWADLQTSSDLKRDLSIHPWLSESDVESLFPLFWDTRELPRQSKLVFFALQGKRFDTLPAAIELLQQSIEHKAVLDEKHASNPLLQSHHPQILFVRSVSQLLERVAQESLSQAVEASLNRTRPFELRSVGITGTNGKTSCTALTAELLNFCTGQTVARMGTLGFFDGHRNHELPFPTTSDFPTFCRCLIHLHNIETKFLVMEVTSHALEENRVGNWKFDLAILTNITADHLDFHGNMENYTNAKMKLFSDHLKVNTGIALVSADRSPVEKFLFCATQAARRFIIRKQNQPPLSEKTAKTECPSQSDTLEVLIQREKLTSAGSEFELVMDNHSVMQIRSPVPGSYQIENLSLAILAARALGCGTDEAIARACTRLSSIPGRLQPIALTHSLLDEHIDELPAVQKAEFSKHSIQAFHAALQTLPGVYVDYAHTPDGLRESLYAIQKIAESLDQTSPREIITVFGCGGDRDRAKRPVMGKIASEMSTQVFITSDNPRTEKPEAILEDICSGIDAKFMAHCIIEADRYLAIEKALHTARASDLVLIAGKGHEDYQIIGHTKHAFSDAAIARSLLVMKLLENLKTG